MCVGGVIAIRQKTSLYVAFIHSIANEFNEINSSRLFCESSTQLFSISCFPTWFLVFHSLISPSHFSYSSHFLYFSKLSSTLFSFNFNNREKNDGSGKAIKTLEKGSFGCVIKFWTDSNCSSWEESIGILFDLVLVVQTNTRQSNWTSSHLKHKLFTRFIRGCRKIN